GLLDSLPQPGSSLLLSQQQDLDHGARSGLLALPLLENIPVLVVAGRPPSLRAPLLQRCRPRQRSRLPLQRFQIVVQIENFLLPPKAALMPCQALALTPYLHVAGMNLG